MGDRPSSFEEGEDVKGLVSPTGPWNADVMVVGESPGADEVEQGSAFVGKAGRALNDVLEQAGLERAEVFVTNVARVRPPGNDINKFFLTKTQAKAQGTISIMGRYPKGEIVQGVYKLQKEISAVQPRVIIAMGNTALWALTGEQGIKDWRSSLMEYKGIRVVPTFHPAYFLRVWADRTLVVHDLKRVVNELIAYTREPKWRFEVEPSYDAVLDKLAWLLGWLNRGPLRLAVDLETLNNHVSCCGIAWSDVGAICIPFISLEKGSAWTSDQMFTIVRKLKLVLTHPNAQCVLQNALFDCQHMARWWGFVPNVYMDTMVAHHVLWPGLRKSLDFLSSLYLDYHKFWKDDRKDWDTKGGGERQLQLYNCMDCVRTWSIAGKLEEIIERVGLQAQNDEQHGLIVPVLKMMLRGVKADRKQQRGLIEELKEAQAERLDLVKRLTRQEINVRSTPQLVGLFYERLGQKPYLNKDKRPRCDEDALKRIGRREPILMRLTSAINEYRSIAGILGNEEKGKGFLSKPLDHDGRMRCSFNLCGTTTYRFSSSENAFGSGLNLQNITDGEKAEHLPNLRKLLVPDEGYVLFDVDLERADLAVVVWEADDDELKQMIREGADIHTESARVVGFSRAMAKRFVHGTNYGGAARTMAINCGITVHEAEVAQKRWFEAHPGIEQWHKRTAKQLRGNPPMVRNVFGYRRVYFDRVEDLLPEALAWIPQSTVAIATNRGLKYIDQNLPWVELLLQVHDSIVGQFPREFWRFEYCEQIIDAMRVTVPYDDPLVMGASIKLSDKSWGHCE